MAQDPRDEVEFDDVMMIALAASADAGAARPIVRDRLLARVGSASVPAGFAFRFADAIAWQPHPIPGIRMQVLSAQRESGYVVLLLDVAPGTYYPAHHHGGAEECYVLSGTVETCGRRLQAGDFLHADAGTDHGGLYTADGCQVLLVVSAADYLS